MSVQISVLYAEDDAADADLTRAHLARHAPDFNLEIVQRAADFLERARSERHSVLLLDQRLPDMDGIDVLKVLIRENITTPVVLVTGAGDGELATAALRLRADHYIAKRPGYLETLPAQLRTVVERHRHQPAAAHRAAPRRILLVDDDRAEAAALIDFLSEKTPHIGVELADSPERALTALTQDETFDLIVCDYVLPRLNGLELMAEIRRLGHSLPFLLVSGLGNEELVVAALKHGASDCVLKHGRHYAELALRIELAIDRHRLQLASLRLGQLSRRLLEVQETERRHLARELHDEIAQVLTAAKMHLQSAALHPEPDRVAEQFQHAVALLDRLLTQVRSLSLDLRPPLLDDLGLLPALHWLVEQQRLRSASPRVQLLADTTMNRCDTAIETACFRIAQEALTNALRHAQAHSVVIALDQEDGALRLSVRDDGCGFDVAAARLRAERNGSLGLLGMSERVSLADGTLTLRSSPGQGTRLEVVFPLSETRPTS